MPASTPDAAGARLAGGNSGASETGARQQQVWENVRKTQAKLAGSLGAQVRSAQSASSLQLALENERLMDAQKGYNDALKAAGESGDDIVGFIFAVNGDLNSADVYPSNGLFRKMWGKLLRSSTTEAIGDKNAGVHLETREGTNAYLFETARVTAPASPSAWVHRNYLAK